ncbi:MAG: peptidase M14 [Deltaproteobacteria bacterium]|nr:peptidase M14 [Deltaproteobacteria bacterium]
MFAPLLVAALAAAPDLATTAEKTGFARTGRLDEAEGLCHAFPRAFPGMARCFSFGTTPEGRPLLALVASARGALTPEKARGLPVVLLQASIHAGEMDGKDAGFLALRGLLARGARGPLGRAVALFVPAFNADGHERFGPGQRPNQAGPEETGWRVTAQNLNLNRDYVKAEAPEMQAMLRLLAAWDPVACADLHATDGARFRHDVAVMVSPALVGPAALAAEGRALRDALLGALEAAGHAPLAFYPEFRERGNPASGFEAGRPPPRLSNGYWPEQHRLGMLVETHSWKDYRTRVAATRVVVETLLAQASARGEAWRVAQRQARDEDRRLAGQEVALGWRAGDRAETIDFLGYAYTREPSAALGAPVPRYDISRPEVWRVPFRGELAPDVVVRAPRGGWVVPPAHASWVAEKLRLHGVSFRVLRRTRAGAAVEAFRAEEARADPQTSEGRTRLTVKGAWREERRDLPAGSLFVPVAQERARLAMHLLEPVGPDSLLAWGYFNAHFEQKEYLEDYVADAFAQELLARDPGAAAELERRMREPAFAQDPKARLELFHRRHPSWDERYRLYPVLRVEGDPGEG